MTGEADDSPRPAYRPPGRPPMRDWPGLLWPACRAFWELARARLKLRTIRATDIASCNAKASIRAAKAQGMAQGAPAQGAAMVAWFIPRIARRVPWRSDCLVQAIAAQRWLASLAIPSEIVIGARRSADSEFFAHAWLKSCGMVITGGDISNYTVLLDAN